MPEGHIPVLREEVLAILHPGQGESVLDVTLGLGGHACAFLEKTGPDGRLTALDADPENLASARKRLAPFESRVRLHQRNFRNVKEVVSEPVDIVFADLGVSSPHFDDPGRGFTFRHSAPLDLRYDRSNGISAAEFLLSESEETITNILREFGEIPRSHALAKALHLHFRSEQRLLGEWKTDDVVRCVEKIFTYRAPKVLPQVFQALRIAVNDELGALQALLSSLAGLLKPGGRAGIISYHSLEDRMVKQTFRAWATPVLDERTGQIAVPASWELLTKKAVSPGESELEKNPRSRSARFRAVRRAT